MKTWNLNPGNQQVHIRRYGFPIVPDFGGTAHSYCGDELKTVIGDLLQWNHLPNLDHALRAYIIRSRVRCLEDLLIVRPYSPMLFRQGEQSGPHLLLQVLQGQLTPEAAKEEWKRY